MHSYDHYDSNSYQYEFTWIISCIHSAHDKIAVNLSINQLLVKPYYVQILKAIIDYKIDSTPRFTNSIMQL